MDFVGDDRHPFLLSFLSFLSSSFFLLHIPSLFFTLPLPNLYTLLQPLPITPLFPIAEKKVQKDSSAAVRKACSSSSSSGGDGSGGIRQELMLKSLFIKVKTKNQRNKRYRGALLRYTKLPSGEGEFSSL